MNRDESFCRAIKADPGDDALRLVYADWLEEQDDPRGEYLRLMVALGEMALTDPRAETHHARLKELEGGIDAKWVALVSAGRVTLRYHRKAFALLNEKPRLSKKNVEMIEAWEKRNRVKLPASVREWYSLKGAEERLRGDLEEFAPFGLQIALNGGLTPHGSPPVRLFAIGDWVTMGEFGLHLGGSDDPLVEIEEPFRDPFSTFVFNRLWSRLTQSDQRYLDCHWQQGEDSSPQAEPWFPLVQADEPAFGKSDITYLEKRFHAAIHQPARMRSREVINPITHKRLYFSTRTPPVFRFFSPTIRVRILCFKNPMTRNQEAHWDISANSTEDLVEAVGQHLWGHRTLSQTLTAYTKAGKAALTALRRRFRNKQSPSA